MLPDLALLLRWPRLSTMLPDLVLLLRWPRGQWRSTLSDDDCTLDTLGAIQHDKSVKLKAVMINLTKQLVTSNLYFKYKICVIRKVFRLEHTPRMTLASTTRTQVSVQRYRLPGLKRRLRMANKPLIWPSRLTPTTSMRTNWAKRTACRKASVASVCACALEWRRVTWDFVYRVQYQSHVSNEDRICNVLSS